jgi:predicted TIM-barrel fold metal-dependent hydrolase
MIARRKAPYPVIAAILLNALALCPPLSAQNESEAALARREASQWRAEQRLVDLHQHIDYAEAHLARAVKIMDANGIGLEVNLSGGTVTHKPGEMSEFERNKRMADLLYPGRFVHYMNLDYSGWDEPDFAQRAADQIKEGHRLGAAGFKEFKRLGLYLRDKSGKLIRVDDPKLDPAWKLCGELGMPVSIHVADPKAFWLPYDEKNERWAELKDHKGWWFGDAQKYPAWRDLLDALTRVIERHPGTTFVCVHFANNAEELETVDKWLDRYPNMMADLAARIPEIGRHDPEAVRRLFVKHQDRILFGTDFQVYDTLTLGSGGSGPAPTDADAGAFFSKHWRWLETRDRGFAHMTPIQGDWTIDAIGLPAPVLRKIYFDNARKLLARSLAFPRIQAARIENDFAPDGDLTKPVWQKARPVRVDCATQNYAAVPELATEVRALWSDRYLYLAYSSPYSQLTQFLPADPAKERMGLWERDVVEAFIGSDLEHFNIYKEFQAAPTGEKLDLALELPKKDFEWSSGFEVAVKVEEKIWRAEWRIPLTAIAAAAPKPGTNWRINLFRCDYEHKALLAWSPTLSGTFHDPAKFGALEFAAGETSKTK